MSKKTEKPIKPKKSIKSIKILKKPTDLVRFWFYKPETEKTESNPTRKKPSLTEKNRAKQKKPSQIEKTEPTLFEPVSVRFWFFIKKIWFGHSFETRPGAGTGPG